MVFKMGHDISGGREEAAESISDGGPSRNSGVEVGRFRGGGVGGAWRTRLCLDDRLVY